MDALLYRYKDMGYLMHLDAADVIELLDMSINKREEEKAWDMWLTQLPYMTKKTFVPFSSYYKSITTPISQRPAEDILREVENIRNKAHSPER